MSNTTENTVNTEAATATVKAAKIVKSNIRSRERMQLGGCGVNAFGAFCGEGVNETEVDFINANRVTLDESLLNAESETVFHVTESAKHGVHAGRCELFKAVSIGERTVDVLRKATADGTRVYYTADVCKGFALVTDKELTAIASEKRDLRQFRQKVRGADGGFADGETVRGALLHAGLGKDYNAVIYRTADGLNVRVILTRKAKEHETEFFVETSALKDADKETMATEIFDGLTVKKAKDATKNAARKARAATVKARKGK